MTVTVKLDAELEQRSRQYAAAAGVTTSQVLREALVAHLKRKTKAEAPSAYALGADLFGRHRGAPDLAARRKAIVADLWSAKRPGPR
jgi:predicted transcriptional regulator